MYAERKQDLSVYYFMKDLFADTPYVNVVDGYPEGDLQLPTVAVDNQEISTHQLEIGNNYRQKLRVWYIEIFAKNKSQRDEFAYRILNALEEEIPVYNYDEGFPPTVSPTQVGTLIADNIKLEVIRIYPELVGTLYYRAVVTLSAQITRLE